MKLPGPKLTQCFNPKFLYENGRQPSGKPRYKIFGFENSEAGIRERFRVLRASGRPDVVIPCRDNCSACKVMRRRQWQLRMHHEMMFREGGSFVTVTYSDENLPQNGSLSPKDHADFIKRLRFHVPEQPFKLLGCGEYGTEVVGGVKLLGRPHFHYALAGLVLEDLEFSHMSGDFPLYKSETMNKAWQEKGHVWIGDLTPQSTGYVISYIDKKKPRYITDRVDPETGLSYYQKVNSVTGEIVDLQPEFQRQSTRPAIGREWYERFASDLFKGFLTYEAKPVRIPETYLRWLEKDFPEQFLAIKDQAREAVDARGFFEGDSTFERLLDRSAHAELVLAKSKTREFG